LGVDHLTAVNLRRHEVDDKHDVPLEDQLAEMAALRDEGKIAGIGLSTVTVEQLDFALSTTAIACVQNAFSLVDQSDTPVLQRCLAEGIPYVPYFPLGSAFPHMPKVIEQAVVKEVASERAISPAQVGLAWLLARSANVLLIPGTSSVAHLEENLAVQTIALSPADLSRLNGLS
jgi:aryl-alcohol dehydrogenase-like predicted oxidoreductase